MIFSMDEKVTVLQWGIVISVSLGAAILDLRTRRIPNMLTLPFLAAGLIWAGSQNGMQGLGEAVAAGAVLATPFVLLFLFAGGGAGDAKLMAAIGAWLGLKQGMAALFCVAAVGIVLAIIKAVLKKRLKSVLTNVFVSIYTLLLFILSGGKRQFTEVKPRGLQNSGRPVDLTIPYGVAIFAGVCLAGVYVLLCQK